MIVHIPMSFGLLLARVLSIFHRIAVAEGKIHGVPPEKVAFHEVGALDSIADIVGACLAFHLLDVDRIVCSPINVGSGVEHTILQLAETVAKVVGFEGGFVFDPSKPDGMPRKLMNSARLRDMGWRAQTSLEDGLKVAYDWYVKNMTQE